MKKIINMVTSLLVVVVVLAAVLMVGMRIAGYDIYTVLSGSMEPTYHVGSLIFVKDVDYTELQEGDVITFMLDEDTVATHRIVDVIVDEEDSTVIRYQTKGDANNTVDGNLVHYQNVIGTPVFTIPAMGYVVSYIQHPPGTYVAIAVLALLLAISFLPDLFAKEEKGEKQKEEKKPQKTNS